MSARPPARPTAIHQSNNQEIRWKPGLNQDNTTIYLDESLDDSRQNEFELQPNKLLDCTNITHLLNNMREIKMITILKFVL